MVRVLEYSAVDDCGVAISPTFVTGQLYGAIAQGIGGALWEDLPYDATAGHPSAQTFKHYLTPRAPDLPSLRLRHQHTPSPFTLLGTKGVLGESGVGGAMAAITNGVNDALVPLGVRIHRLPLNPPNVLAAILEGTGDDPHLAALPPARDRCRGQRGARRTPRQRRLARRGHRAAPPDERDRSTSSTWSISRTSG